VSSQSRGDVGVRATDEEKKPGENHDEAESPNESFEESGIRSVRDDPGDDESGDERSDPSNQRGEDDEVSEAPSRFGSWCQEACREAAQPVAKSPAGPLSRAMRSD
jgi:hypothetical protein